MSTPRRLNLDPSIRRLRLAGAGVELAALVVEPEMSGSDADSGTVVLVHGFTGSKEDFGALLPIIAAAGYRAVALDLRGQHESDEHDETFDIARFAADLVEVVRGQGGPVHLVGHSFGGLVAREAVLMEPAGVASLTLMCSGSGAVPVHHTPALQAFDQAMAAGAIDAVWEFMRGDRITSDPDVDEQVLLFLERRLRSGHPNAHRAIARGLIEIPDRTAELAATGVPVLVMFGEDDDVWPLDEQRSNAAALSGSVIEISGAGHSPAVDRPEATGAELVTWIALLGPR